MDLFCLFFVFVGREVVSAREALSSDVFFFSLFIVRSIFGLRDKRVIRDDDRNKKNQRWSCLRSVKLVSTKIPSMKVRIH